MCCNPPLWLQATAPRHWERGVMCLMWIQLCSWWLLSIADSLITEELSLPVACLHCSIIISPLQLARSLWELQCCLYSISFYAGISGDDCFPSFRTSGKASEKLALFELTSSSVLPMLPSVYNWYAKYFTMCVQISHWRLMSNANFTKVQNQSFKMVYHTLYLEKKWESNAALKVDKLVIPFKRQVEENFSMPQNLKILCIHSVKW